jgi:hypothetical protein
MSGSFCINPVEEGIEGISGRNVGGVVKSPVVNA